jgi:proteic killer suppression protein
MVRMEIAFATTRQEKVFNEWRKLLATYGQERANRIKLRMPVLAAAPNLAAVPTAKPVRCHQLTQDRKGGFAVDLIANWRLTFRPDHDPVPRLSDGGIDTASVTAIRIIDVEDYH